MKRFEDLNYYQILEIPVRASSFEIREAYRDALSIYNEDSLTTYSLFTDDERDKILKKIEEAFLTLIDENKRADYDSMLVSSGKVDATDLITKDRKKPIPLFPTNNSTNGAFFFKRVQKKIAGKDVNEISNEILSKELISGSELRRLRKAIGIKLEEVFEITRIALTILNSIENDQFESLPPIIYLKNFLRQYSEILQLDSKRIVEGYIKNIALRHDTV